MRHITLRAIAAIALVPLAISLSPSAPEKAPMSKEALRKNATHIVLGAVQRVYEVKEKERGWKYTRRLAEIRVDGVEKAPAEAEGSLEGSLVYARWFSRRSTRLIPLPDASGHHGWAPRPGDRVRVHLARNAYDGFVSAKENDDGGYNVLVPNGFEKLEKNKTPR